MRRARREELLPLVGILCLMLLGLAGCDTGGGGKGGTAQSTSRLALRISTANQPASGTLRQGGSPGQTRASPGARDFITRLSIRVEAADIPTPITSSVTLTATQQDQVTVELRVPVGASRRIIVMAVNALEEEIFRGEKTVTLALDVEPVDLLLGRVLIPVAASAANLADKAFPFASGAAFGVAGAVTLAFGPFVGTQGVFTLTSGSFTASGSVILPSATTTRAQHQAAADGQARQTTSCTSCNFAVGTSIGVGGPQAGARLCVPCQVDDVDGRLIVVDSAGVRSTSAPPVGVPVSSPFPFILDVGRLDSDRERLQ